MALENVVRQQQGVSAVKLFSIAFVLCSLANAAFAQTQQCGPRDKMLAGLAIKYSEARQFIGLTETGLVVEVFAAWSGTWTVTVTHPDGKMCILTSGYSYEAMLEVPGFPG